jgi:hypothetical protein
VALVDLWRNVLREHSRNLALVDRAIVTGKALDLLQQRLARYREVTGMELHTADPVIRPGEGSTVDSFLDSSVPVSRELDQVIARAVHAVNQRYGTDFRARLVDDRDHSVVTTKV